MLPVLRGVTPDSPGVSTEVIGDLILKGGAKVITQMARFIIIQIIFICFYY
jgi:hypothetical protein